MYKLVVFDLDGTLANTLLDLANAVNVSLREHGLATHDVECYKTFVGNGINSLIRQVLMDKAEDKELFNKVKAFFDFYYPQHLCDYTCAYDGMDKVLAYLSECKVKTAVHSNKPHIFVPQILKKLYPDHEFDIAWGRRDCFERKPSAQALLAMMQKLGVTNDETIYVGDSDVDVKTAHNADVRVCGVQWGFRGRAELECAGADFIAEDADDLLKILMG